jgi:predicted transglutaminase-like cysteine proteinase
MCVSRRVVKGLLFVLVAFCLSAPPARAGARLPNSSYVPFGAETTVPFGWAEFCRRYSGECEEETRQAGTIKMTAVAFRKLESINALVNNRIAPVSDADHAAVPDAWDYPEDGKGDCEDYALLKRRLLAEAGFPRGALLLAVVKDENGDGHAVLMARTSRGDFVLDNLVDDVKPWTRTPYRFVKRQSQENQNVWVAIGATTAAPTYVSNRP